MLEDGRQFQDEAPSPGLPGNCFELPAEQTSQPPGQGKAEAYSPALAGGIGDVDVEDLLYLALRNPGPPASSTV